MNTHHYVEFSVEAKTAKQAELLAKEACRAYFDNDPFIITELHAKSQMTDADRAPWTVTVVAEKAEKVKHT
jgi:hypothetical protein